MAKIRRADHPVRMRTCGGCGELLLADAFALDRQAADGLQSFCRECKRKAAERAEARRAEEAAAAELQGTLTYEEEGAS